MNDKKDIEVSNGAFDLKIHWNKGVMSLQSALLIGCGALFICTNSKPVRNLILLALIADALCVLFYFISTHKRTEDSTGEQTTEGQTTAPPDTDVQHNKSRNRSVRQTNATIKNRVASPVTNVPTHHGAMQQEAVLGEAQTQPEVELTPTVPVERPVDTPASEPQQANADVDLHEDLGDDWGNFFDI